MESYEKSNYIVENLLYVTEIEKIDFSKHSKVHLGQGEYEIFNTIYIPENCELTLDRQTVIKVCGNIEGVHLAFGAAISGGEIRINIANYNSCAVYVEGATKSSKWSTKIEDTRIDNPFIGGIGILYEDITGGGVVYNITKGCYIAGFDYGLKFISPKVESGWANANTLKDLTICNCKTAIGCYMQGCFSANFLKNISIQTYASSFVSALDLACAAEFNKIEFMSWDMTDYVNAFTLSEKTAHNKIFAPLLYNVGRYTDNGTNNVVETCATVKGKDIDATYKLDLTSLDSSIQYPVIFKGHYNFTLLKTATGVFPQPFTLKMEGVATGWGHYASYYKVFVQSLAGGEVCSLIDSDDSSDSVAVYLRGGAEYEVIDYTHAANQRPLVITDKFTDNNFVASPIYLSGDLRFGVYADTGIINITTRTKPFNKIGL